MNEMKEKIIKCMVEEITATSTAINGIGRAADRILSLFEKKCVWVQCESAKDCYETSCNEIFNKHIVKVYSPKRCPECGGEIEIKEDVK